MSDIIPQPGAEEAARRTAAAAALADYRRETQGAPQPVSGPIWTQWAGRLAAALGSVLEIQPGLLRVLIYLAVRALVSDPLAGEHCPYPDHAVMTTAGPGCAQSVT